MKFILSIFLLLFSFEFICSRTIEPLNNIKGYTWGKAVYFNSLGFREKEIGIKTKPRIMVLGDSFTMGVGLEEKERYTNLVQKRFPELEILNFSNTGAPTTLEAERLRKYINIIKPNRVVIGFCWNDPWTNDSNYSASLFKEAHKDLFYSLDTFSFILPNISRTVRKGFLLYAIRNWKNDLREAYITSNWQWKNFVTALKEIKGLSDSNNLKPPIFIVLNSGVYPNVKYNYFHPDVDLAEWLLYYHKAEKTANKIGFITGNVEKELGSLGLIDMSINKWDAHPNALLNKIYANKLAELLNKKEN